MQIWALGLLLWLLSWKLTVDYLLMLYLEETGLQIIKNIWFQRNCWHLHNLHVKCGREIQVGWIHFCFKSAVSHFSDAVIENSPWVTMEYVDDDVSMVIDDSASVASQSSMSNFENLPIIYETLLNPNSVIYHDSDSVKIEMLLQIHGIPINSDHQGTYSSSCEWSLCLQIQWQLSICCGMQHCF